jgi:hypothetical protein
MGSRLPNRKVVKRSATVLVRSKFVQLSRATVSANSRSGICYDQQFILQQIDNMPIQCIYINLFTYRVVHLVQAQVIFN